MHEVILWQPEHLLVSLLVSHEAHRDDTNMLNDTRVRNAKRADRPIKLSDSGGLHPLIQPNGSKLWRLAYRFGGKQKTLAIGVYPTVTLKRAGETRRSQAPPRRRYRSLHPTPTGKAEDRERL